MPLVAASEIAKTYGMRPVLRGVSLGVERGEFVAVLGANGAGKTTFLRILSTLSRPDSGKLHYRRRGRRRAPGPGAGDPSVTFPTNLCCIRT